MSSQKKCILCGKTFNAERITKIYCSDYCARKDWNEKHPEKVSEMNKRSNEKEKRIRAEQYVPIIKKCLICGKEFTCHIFNPLQKYCSLQCNKLSFRDKLLLSKRKYYRENKEKILAQLSILHDKSRFGGLRRKAMERDGFQCVHCGKEYPTFRLVVHHKDGNNKNNVMENFMTLCLSCHRKEHWRMKE